MSDILLPCPFCGGKAQSQIFGGYPYVFTVSCQSCECGHASAKSIDEAVKAWNTRKSDTLTIAELKMLVRRLARKLPEDSPLRLQAVDYLRRKFVPSDILRDADEIGRVEQT